MSDTLRVCEHCGKALGQKAVQGLCPECFLKVGLGSDDGLGEGGARRGHFAPPTPEELAPHFPQLDIIQLLGTGGMGAVYKARQKTLNRIVALKVLPPAPGRNPAFAERFTREAQALARLNHPGIIAVHEFGFVPCARIDQPAPAATDRAGEAEASPDGFFFFVMEFVDGVNLRQMLRAERLSPREAMAIVPQICEALQYAHDQGIVHRDIKPENVLIDKQGRVKIADFGLAKLLGREMPGEPLTRSAEVMGTPQYMAPEQLERPLAVDHRADIYSLGVIFYEMLTGELPLGRFPNPSACQAGVQIDVRLDAIVLRALEKQPELRYQQARQLKTQVETIAGAPAPGTAAAQAPMRPKASHAPVYAIVALALLSAGTTGYFAYIALHPARSVPKEVVVRETPSSGLPPEVVDIPSVHEPEAAPSESLPATTASKSDQDAGGDPTSVPTNAVRTAMAPGAETNGASHAEAELEAASTASSPLVSAETPTNPPPPSLEEQTRDLRARLDTARLILSSAQRDAALAAVARDAGAAGNAEIAGRAVAEIVVFDTRDNAAHQAARGLLQNGRRNEALAVAQSITSLKKRDAVLRELAESAP